MMRRSIRTAHGELVRDGFVAHLLLILGGETELAHHVLGDLEEEYRERKASSGTLAARVRYALQALTSLPYLIADGMRNGSSGARARLGFLLGVPALAGALVAIALAVRAGPPATLLPLHSAEKGIVISSTNTVDIPMRVLDADGKAISGAPVRFAWESGLPIAVSEAGEVQCTRRGIASVRASLGDLVTRIKIDCQPVMAVYTKEWYNLIVGGPPATLLLGGWGTDGKPVTRLAADVGVINTDIATTDGTSLRAHAPGRTSLTVRVGLNAANAMITVFEPVPTLTGLRDDQLYVIASAEIKPNQTVRWPLPAGNFSLVNHIDREGSAPVMGVAGDVSCHPTPGRGVYRTFCGANAGASVTLTHPGTREGSIIGRLALERDSL
jgi:hypothetical protein